jgi:hypothetical protein
MIVTIGALYFAAAYGLELTAWIMIAAVFIDLVAWSSIANALSGEQPTGTTK